MHAGASQCGCVFAFVLVPVTSHTNLPTTATKLAIIVHSFQGFTSLVHKVDSLVYALNLEINTGDPQASLAGYGEQVLSCLSDQGPSTSHS